MIRPITADHIKFSECIEVFKPFGPYCKKDTKRFFSYLFLDFELPHSWEFSDFSIHETLGDWNNQIQLASLRYSAFIAPVLIPTWVDQHFGHLFTIVLSSVLSFCTGRSVKSVKDSYLINEKITTRPEELAIHYPVLTAGPGGYHPNIAVKRLQEFKKRVEIFLGILNKLSDSNYKSIFQAVRLVHLALLLKREDYDLSFSLLVAAIESIAQKAFNSDEEKLLSLELDQDEKEVEKLCLGKSNLESWFKKSIIQKAKLQTKYVEFIFKYAPVKNWYELRHQSENYSEYISEMTGRKEDNNWLTKQMWDEVYPLDLDDKSLRRIIKDTYKYRSGFFHEGNPTPHQDPNEYKRFFEDREVINLSNREEPIKFLLLPKFELMCEIARISITEYIKSLTK